MPCLNVPSCGRKGASFSNYAQQVNLWRHVATLDQVKRASALILHMDAVASQVCVAAGGDVIIDRNGVDKISAMSRGYPTPEDVDPVCPRRCAVSAIQPYGPNDGRVPRAV